MEVVKPGMKNYKNFLLTILLVFAPLAIGSIHPWSITVCLALSIILFASEIFERGIERNAPSLGLAGWVLIGLCAFTLLQLAPLPAWLVRAISPRSYEIQAGLYVSLLKQPPPSFMTLSLDRASTLMELMKLAAGVLLFLAMRQRVRKEGSSDVLWCVAWSGVAVSVVFFMHRLAGWQRVYEIYSPIYAMTSPLSAPLLNPNHLAGYLGLSAAVAVGLAFSEKELMRRLMLIFAAGFTGGGVFLTLSRGGILAFLGGQLLFIVLRVVAQPTAKEKKTGRETKFLPLALAVALASGFYVAYRAVLKEFLYGDTEKLKIPMDAILMVRDFWLAGVGRGAFAQGYTVYQQLEDGVTYTHPENFVAQYLSEWGMIAGGAFILLLLGVLLMGLVKPPGRGRNAGALAALFAIVVQNFADFSLELLGVSLPFMVLLSCQTVTVENALGMAHRGGEESEGFTHKYVPGGLGALGMIAAILLAVLGCIRTSRHGLEEETTAVKKAFAAKQPPEKFLQLLRPVMERHPADYYFPLLAGIKIYHAEAKNPLPYLARAVTLYPKSSAAHLYIARTLARSGFLSQSLLEYMQAARSSPALAGKIAAEVVLLAGKFDIADGMTRTDDDRLLMYEPLALAFIAAHLDEESEKADEAVLKIDPFLEGAAGRKVRRLIGKGRLDEALEFIRVIEAEAALKPLALELRGEMEVKRGNLAVAASQFLAAWKKEPARTYLLLRAAQSYASAGDKENMYKYLSQFEAASPDERSKGNAILQRAGLEYGLKMYDTSLASYQAAAAALPDEPSIWQSVASIAVMKNDTAIQLKAYKELRRLQPDNAEWKKRIEEIENRLNSTMLEQ